MSQLKEKKGLRISIFGSFILAGLGISFAFISGSQAILLDGTFNLISAVMALIALKVVELLNKPATHELPVGYATTEPLFIFGKGLILLVITVFIIFSNISIMLSGGQELQLGMVLIYVTAATIGNVVLFLLISRISKQSPSPLLLVEKANWKVNMLITSGIAFTFVIAIIFRNHAFIQPYFPYLDQIIVIAVGVFTLSIPIGTVKSGLRDLLLIAPAEDTRSDINDLIEFALAGSQIIHWNFTVIRTGRKYWISVYLVPEKKTIDADFSESHAQKITAAIKPHYPNLQVDCILQSKD